VGRTPQLCVVLRLGSHDPDPRVGAPDQPFLEGWTMLSALAAVTTRIRLATLCTAVGYRNPTHLAKIAATVDLISRGRMTLGIGAGFFEDEYRQYGWEFPPRPATRIGQMEEAVELNLKTWTEPRATFHGRYFHAEDAILEPKPVQKPRPPVLIAGGGEQMTLRAVARLADAATSSTAILRRYGISWRRRVAIATRSVAITTDRKDPCPGLASRPQRRRSGGEARAADCSRTVARFFRYGVRGHRPDRTVPGRRHRPADQWRSE
jgi:alkanesulfonate monooxygenase SsuD/methylene tetrahydromethanopterin reductase-like flavin-dependent oxidoreductase (luciferase family)